MAQRVHRSVAALFAAVLLTGTLGSIHAFSVFIAPLELAHGASRGDVSLVYSLALVSLTAAVLTSHLFFRFVRPATLCLLIGMDCALGLAVAALFDGLWAVFIGYGLIFGFANGLGYALALQLASRAFPTRAASMMGVVTAVYALGAMTFARLFDGLIVNDGLSTTFGVMAAVMAGIALIGATATGLSRITLAGGSCRQRPDSLPLPSRLTGLFWLAYGTGCLAGLMAIGHAAGIVRSTGGTEAQATAGIALIALGNAGGGFLAGGLADRLPVRSLICVAAAGSSCALLGLGFAQGPVAALIWLALIGAAYGAIIALFPALTLAHFGANRMAHAYGRIFTAWGTAGLLGPWVARITL